MLKVRLASCSPVVVVSVEIIFRPYDLALEICCEGRVILSETCMVVSKNKTVPIALW